MERKKRSKGRGWESCYVKKIYGTFGVEMRAYGQKLVKFCTHTHTRLSYSSIDDRKTNIWVKERTKVIDIISNVRKNEMVLGRAYQPPQRRPMDLACHHLDK